MSYSKQESNKMLNSLDIPNLRAYIELLKQVDLKTCHPFAKKMWEKDDSLNKTIAYCEERLEKLITELREEITTNFSSDYDCAKYDVHNLYDEPSESLRKALAANIDFNTGWYSCKHEAHTSCIRRINNDKVCVIVSATDDNDVEVSKDELCNPIYEEVIALLQELAEQCEEELDQHYDNKLEERMFI